MVSCNMSTPDLLLNERRELMTLAGVTLLSIQYLEHLIFGSVLMLNGHNMGFSIEDYFSEDLAKSGPPLGKLIKGLASAVDLPLDFDARLKRFTGNRNRFTHRLFTDCLAVSEPVCIETCSVFLQELLEESEALHLLFLSFVCIISKKTGSVDLQFDEIAKRYSDFDAQGEFLLKNIKALKKVNAPSG